MINALYVMEGNTQVADTLVITELDSKKMISDYESPHASKVRLNDTITKVMRGVLI